MTEKEFVQINLDNYNELKERLRVAEENFKMLLTSKKSYVISRDRFKRHVIYTEDEATEQLIKNFEEKYKELIDIESELKSIKNRSAWKDIKSGFLKILI